MSAQTVVAPCRANKMAVARPMPDPAPVTNATLATSRGPRELDCNLSSISGAIEAICRKILLVGKFARRLALDVQFHDRMNFPHSVVRHVFATVVLLLRSIAYVPVLFAAH